MWRTWRRSDAHGLLRSPPLLCFLVAIALLPAAAQADIALPQVPVPASDALSSTAHALAVARWGVDPCAGQVTVSWAHMGPGINARSKWMSYDIHNPATYSQCSISYNLDIDGTGRSSARSSSMSSATSPATTTSTIPTT